MEGQANVLEKQKEEITTIKPQSKTPIVKKTRRVCKKADDQAGELPRKKTTRKPANPKLVVGRKGSKKLTEAGIQVLDTQDEKPESSIAEIQKLSLDAARLKYKIEKGEEILKNLKHEYNKMVMDSLPSKMSLVGLSKFSLDNGISIQIKDKVAGSLPKSPEGRKSAIAYLRKIGGGKLITESIDMMFEKGDKETPKEVQSFLNALGVTFQKKQDVHHSSLASFGRQILESAKTLKDGSLIELSKIGLHCYSIADIKIPEEINPKD